MAHPPSEAGKTRITNRNDCWQIASRNLQAKRGRVRPVLGGGVKVKKANAAPLPYARQQTVAHILGILSVAIEFIVQSLIFQRRAYDHQYRQRSTQAKPPQ